MPYFELEGLDGIVGSFDELADMPDDVAEAMLNAEADVVLKAQKSTGEAMGVHRTGVTLDSLQKTAFARIQQTGNASMRVEFVGNNADGNRNAEVAFINEYGKTNQPSRPFVHTANENSAAETTMAAWRIYDNYLKSKNL